MNNITRRHFFGKTATGIGVAALASVFGKDARAAERGLVDWRDCRTSRRRPSASSISSSRAAHRRWSCSTTSRA